MTNKISFREAVGAAERVERWEYWSSSVIDGSYKGDIEDRDGQRVHIRISVHDYPCYPDRWSGKTAYYVALRRLIVVTLVDADSKNETDLASYIFLKDVKREKPTKKFERFDSMYKKAELELQVRERMENEARGAEAKKASERFEKEKAREMRSSINKFREIVGD